MRARTKIKVAQEVLNWRHEGLISPEVAQLLATRYETGASLMSTALRWLGFFAVLLLGMSILGLIGLALGEAALYIAPFLLAALSAAAWYFGVQMASNPEQRYPLSGAALLTVGLIGGFGALSLFLLAFAGDVYEEAYPYLMLAIAAAALATAYRYGLRWPLALGILVFFHALGNWHAYAGHGAYVLGIRDERITAIAASVVLGLGIWHESQLEHSDEGRWIGFGHLYIVFGLLYVNVCAWFLSLFPGGLSWVLVFTALALAQLVIGARLHDTRFVGFGVAFLSIDIYTRFYENFWDSLSKGMFFLVAGLVGMVAGSLMELRSRQRRGGAQP